MKDFIWDETKTININNLEDLEEYYIKKIGTYYFVEDSGKLLDVNFNINVELNNIVARNITGKNIKAGSITANNIEASNINCYEITATNITASTINTAKIKVQNVIECKNLICEYSIYCSHKIKANDLIKIRAGGDLIAHNIRANKVDVKGNIYCKELHCFDLKAWDIKANEVTTHNANIMNIIANNIDSGSIEYDTYCIAINDLDCDDFKTDNSNSICRCYELHKKEVEEVEE